MKEKIVSKVKDVANFAASLGVGAVITVGTAALICPHTRGIGKVLCGIGGAALASAAMSTITKDNEKMSELIQQLSEVKEQNKLAREALERATEEGVISDEDFEDADFTEIDN